MAPDRNRVETRVAIPLGMPDSRSRFREGSPYAPATEAASNPAVVLDNEGDICGTVPAANISRFKGRHDLLANNVEVPQHSHHGQEARSGRAESSRRSGDAHPLKAERSKSLPRTGEPRQRRRVLSIDLLPMDVLEAIKLLRSQSGFTWQEIERLSSLPYSPKWRAEQGKHGFVDWDELPPAVLKAFPKLRLPHSNLHRWYDLQVEQKQKEALVQAEQARVIAQAFAEAGIDQMDDAVMNALRDLVFGMMLQVSDDGRSLIVKNLLAMAKLMNRDKANSIKERSVTIEERKLALMKKAIELKRKRQEQETEGTAKKLNKGRVVTIEDINRIRERVFGLPPVAEGG